MIAFAHHRRAVSPRASTIVLPTTNLLSWLWAEQGVSTSGGLITSVANQVSGGNAFVAGATAPALTTYNGCQVIDCTATGVEHLTHALTMPGGVSRQTVYVVVYIQAYGSSGAMLWGVGANSLYWFLSNDNNIYVQGAGTDVPITDFATARAAGKFALLTLYASGSTTKVRVNGVTQSGTGGAPASIPAGSLPYRVNTYAGSGSYNGKVKYGTVAIYAAPTDPTNAEMSAVEAAILAFYPR